MNKYFTGLSVGVMMLGMAAVASADSVLTTEINMDNGYKIYLSTNDTSEGILFDSFENHYITDTASVDLLEGVDYYLHVYGYNISGNAGFLGEFNLSGSGHIFSNNSNTLFTNTTNWRGNNSGWGSSYSSVADLGLNDGSTYPWGFFNVPTGAIPPTANWIWVGDNTITNSTAYFTTKISSVAAPVPEPATMILFGTGLAGLVAARRRKKAC